MFLTTNHLAILVLLSPSVGWHFREGDRTARLPDCEGVTPHLTASLMVLSQLKISYYTQILATSNQTLCWSKGRTLTLVQGSPKSGEELRHRLPLGGPGSSRGWAEARGVSQQAMLCTPNCPEETRAGRVSLVRASENSRVWRNVCLTELLECCPVCEGLIEQTIKKPQASQKFQNGDPN